MVYRSAVGVGMTNMATSTAAIAAVMPTFTPLGQVHALRHILLSPTGKHHSHSAVLTFSEFTGLRAFFGAAFPACLMAARLPALVLLPFAADLPRAWFSALRSAETPVGFGLAWRPTLFSLISLILSLPKMRQQFLQQSYYTPFCPKCKQGFGKFFNFMTN